MRQGRIRSVVGRNASLNFPQSVAQVFDLRGVLNVRSTAECGDDIGRDLILKRLRRHRLTFFLFEISCYRNLEEWDDSAAEKQLGNRTSVLHERVIATNAE